jgi:hypothetical protein
MPSYKVFTMIQYIYINSKLFAFIFVLINRSSDVNYKPNN